MRLELGANYIADKGATALGKMLAQNDTLAVLDLGRCEITATGVAALVKPISRRASSSALQTLDISGGGEDRIAIGDDGATAVAGALSANETITELRLGCQEIGAAGAAAVAAMLQANRALRTLVLERNAFGPEGAAAVAGPLAESPLTALNVARCKIGAAGATALFQSLRANASLVELNVCGDDTFGSMGGWGEQEANNDGFGDAGAQQLIEILQVNSTLRKLDVRKNGITKAVCDQLTEVLVARSEGAATRAAAEAAAAAAVPRAAGDGGSGGGGGAAGGGGSDSGGEQQSEAVARALEQIRSNTLVSLELSDEDVNDEQVAEIARALARPGAAFRVRRAHAVRAQLTQNSRARAPRSASPRRRAPPVCGHTPQHALRPRTPL